MIQHTLIFSFPDRTEGEIDEFVSEIAALCVRPDAAFDFVSTRHVATVSDAHEPVLVPTVMVRMSFDSVERMEELSASDALNEFRSRQQRLHPYDYVWINHAPLR